MPNRRAKTRVPPKYWMDLLREEVQIEAGELGRHIVTSLRKSVSLCYCKSEISSARGFVLRRRSEPAASSVTGRRSDQLNYVPAFQKPILCDYSVFLWLAVDSETFLKMP